MKRSIREEDRFFARVRKGRLEYSHMMSAAEGIHL
jgi:hypothetical protein